MGVEVKGTGDQNVDLLQLAGIRRAASRARGSAQLAILNSSPAAHAFASRKDVAEISTRGPVTPDHVLYTKHIAAVCESDPHEDVPGITAFAEDYERYFSAHDNGTNLMHDPAPRWAVWKNTGTLSFGNSADSCQTVSDIVRHTVWAIQTGESLGGWQSLP